MINMNKYNAAQNKAVIAQFLGDKGMWSAAILDLHVSQQPQPGIHMTGAIELASELLLEDVEMNFLSYGDLTIFCGDSRLAESCINLEIEPVIQIHRPKWCA